ncbi:MAG: hypothetical protein KGI66_02095 [Patescibacteria group bacterium]|nr:hypothetical protein [Patescibacteria group bacterium]
MPSLSPFFQGATGTAQGLLSKILGAGGPYQSLMSAGSAIPSAMNPQQESQLYGSLFQPIQAQSQSALQRGMDIAGRTGAEASLIPLARNIGMQTASRLSDAGGKGAQEMLNYPLEAAKAKGALYDMAMRGLQEPLAAELGFAGRMAPEYARPSLLSQILAGAAGTGIQSLLHGVLSRAFSTGGAGGAGGSILPDLSSVSVGSGIGPALASALGAL